MMMVYGLFNDGDGEDEYEPSAFHNSISQSKSLGKWILGIPGASVEPPSGEGGWGIVGWKF